MFFFLNIQILTWKTYYHKVYALNQWPQTHGSRAFSMWPPMNNYFFKNFYFFYFRFSIKIDKKIWCYPLTFDANIYI